MTVKQLEKEIATIKQRLAKLEKRERRKNGHGEASPKLGHVSKTSRTRSPQDRHARVLARLRQQGLLSEPSLDEKRIVAAWLEIPESVRRKQGEAFQNAQTQTSLADIVSENRR